MQTKQKPLVVLGSALCYVAEQSDAVHFYSVEFKVYSYCKYFLWKSNLQFFALTKNV